MKDAFNKETAEKLGKMGSSLEAMKGLYKDMTKDRKLAEAQDNSTRLQASVAECDALRRELEELRPMKISVQSLKVALCLWMIASLNDRASG